MDEVDRAAGDAAEEDPATDRLRLGDRRPGGGVVGEGRLPGRDQLAPGARQDVVVLGVHLDQEAGAARPLHQAMDREVVHVEDGILIGRVYLGAAHAAVHDPFQVSLPAVVEVGDVEVERPVDDRARLSLPADRRKCLFEPLVRVLGGEIDIGRDASGRRRSAPTWKVVGGPSAPGVEREVGVGVDDARQHVEPGGVDGLRVGHGHARLGYLGHPAVADDDVGLSLAVVIDDGASPDQQAANAPRRGCPGRPPREPGGRAPSAAPDRPRWLRSGCPRADPSCWRRSSRHTGRGSRSR